MYIGKVMFQRNKGDDWECGIRLESDNVSIIDKEGLYVEVIWDMKDLWTQLSLTVDMK